MTEYQALFEEDNAEYKAFVDKFKPKKTTDDCYTPAPIFDCIRDYATKRFNFPPEAIVRPYPLLPVLSVSDRVRVSPPDWYRRPQRRRRHHLRQRRGRQYIVCSQPRRPGGRRGDGAGTLPGNHPRLEGTRQSSEEASPKARTPPSRYDIRPHELAIHPRREVPNPPEVLSIRPRT